MKITALVMRHEPDVTLPAGFVPVTVDFDPRKPPIGRAVLRKDARGDVYADIELLAEPPKGTPAAALRNGELLEVSICASGNVDPTIPPLSVESDQA
jgi:hypothetical protein